MSQQLIEEYAGYTDERLDAELRANELASRELQARRSALIAVADSRRLYANDGHHSMKGYLTATCNWSNAEVVKQRKLARLLDAIPAIGDALLAGHIGAAQAVEITRIHANPRITTITAAFTPLLLDQAEHLPFTDFTNCVDLVIARADQDGALADIEANAEHRRATVTEHNGAVDIAATGGDAMTAARLIAIHQHFTEQEFLRDTEARRAEHGDSANQHPLPRTASQRAFDALVKIFDTAAAAEDLDTPSNPLVTILCSDATVDDTFTRAGLMLPDGNQIALDELDSTTMGVLVDHLTDLTTNPDSVFERRCETSTGIQIHPMVMLRAALTGYVRRAVIDSRGVVTDYGRTQRLFTGPARAAARLLTRTCVHPGCDIPAAYCDVDHNDEWHAGGCTDQDNANIECGPHDRFKHCERWRTRRDDLGRIYTIRADGTLVLPVGERPPDLTADEHTHLARQRLRALNTAA